MACNLSSPYNVSSVILGGVPALQCNDSRLEQFFNTADPISVTFDGIVMVFSPVQLKNAPILIEVMFSGIVTSVNALQPENVKSLKSDIPLERVTFFRLVQLLKAS